jgi:hypothetical protein
METGGLAVGAEGVLVRRRQVSPVMVERSISILMWLVFSSNRI